MSRSRIHTSAVLLACGAFGPWAVAAAVPDEALPERLVVWSAPLKQDDNSSLAATAGVWTPDGKHVLTAGWAKPAGLDTAGEVRVWDAAAGRHVRSFRGSAVTYAKLAGHLAVSPDGKSVAAGGWSGTPNLGPCEYFVEVWDWDREKKPRLKLGGFQTYVSGVAFSPDGKVLAAIDVAGTLQAWEVGTGKRVYQSAVKGGRRWGLAYHPTLPVLTAADDDGALWFFDAATGAVRDPKILVPGGFLYAAFAPDGRSVAYGGLHGKVSTPLRVYGVQATKAGGLKCDDLRCAPKELPDVGCVYQVAFSPDGKHLAAACQDRTVRVFDPATGELTAVAMEHADFVYSVAFSPDGKRLLSVGRDSVKVWSVAELLKRKPK